MEIFKIKPVEANCINPLRIRILLLMENGLRTRKTLANKLKITPQAISWHIRILEDAGLLKVNRVRNRDFRLENHYELTHRGFELLRHLDIDEKAQFRL